MTPLDEMKERLRKAQEKFAVLVREFGEDSLLAAARDGTWYDRRPLKLWQLDVIRRELEDRKAGCALPPSGKLPPLTVTIHYGRT